MISGLLPAISDPAIRGAGIAIFLLIVATALRDACQVPAARYGALLASCGAAYLVEAAPGLAEIAPPWLVPIRVLSVSAPGVFWVWAAARFDENFVPSWHGWLPWLGLAAIALWAVLHPGRTIWLLVQLAAIAIVAAAIWRALAGRGGDLVESSRRFRLVLAIAAALCIAGFNLAELLPHSAGRGGSGGLLGAISVAALGFAAALQTVRVRPPSEASALAVPAITDLPTAPPVATAADPEADRLLQRLDGLMGEDKIYREEGLGIAALASRLGVPEYRLRRLINQHLGHRNFSTFVNGYRLADAKAALADPGQARVPILTIALDAGFQSIGPFNRAFKSQFGVTPSEFRRASLAADSRAAD